LNRSQVSIDSSEADRFIEQLMHEAQTDPKLRALTYGSENTAAGSAAGKQKPNLTESYPMVARPYRTQQDMIIREREESPNKSGIIPVERHRMPKRPYRTNEDLRIVEKNAEERSKSADGRLSGIEAFKRKDPKLEKFRRTPSTGNVTEELLNGVVTDNEHHGVKDLVAMIEKNTK
jgi:hypothetical protein